MITIERTMTAAPLRDVEALPVLLFEGEINAHRFQISPPERVAFSGMDVTARFVRSDQTDVALTGWLDERGRANVVLTEGCYLVTGVYKLFLYVVDGEKTVCVYACTGSVLPTVGENGPAPERPTLIETYGDGALTALEARIAAVETGDAFMPALVPYREEEMVASYDYHAGEIIAVGMDLYQVLTDLEPGDALKTTNPGRNVMKTSLRKYLSGSGRAAVSGAHAEGGSTATKNGAHAEGMSSTASGGASHAEGTQTEASGISAHAEGRETVASDTAAHAEGDTTTASKSGAHAEGHLTTASGYYSHAEGEESVASGNASHAEGYGEASGPGSHAENGGTASGMDSHAEGGGTVASGSYSHAEGDSTTASGIQSHAEGEGTIAKCLSQHVFGEYNVPDPSDNTITRGTFVEIVGNGTGMSARSNARTLDWSGNESLAGGLTLGMGSALESFISPLQLRSMLIRAASGRCHVVRGTGYGGVLLPAPVLTPDGVIFGDAQANTNPGNALGYFFVDDYGCVIGALPYNTGLIRYDKDLANPPAIFPRSGYVHMDFMMFWDAENQTVIFKTNQNEQEPVMNLYLFGSWTWNAGTGRLFDADYTIVTN